jgi:D-sedoheptulose 7-phosphate isomerase
MTDHAARAIKDLQISRDVFDRALADPSFIEQVARATELATDALRSGRKILFAGNGGSAADAQHLATELVVRFIVNRRALPAIALTTDSSILTAIGNDLGFDQLFARQIAALGQEGDVLVAISTSGRSANIVAACREARARKLSVIGLTGADGGSMSELCDVLVCVPSDKTAFIQQVHIAVGHIICAAAEDEAMGKPAVSPSP